MTRNAIAAWVAFACGVAHADTKSVAKEVARVRGLPAKRVIDEESVSADEIKTRLAALAGDRTAEGRALECWGLIPPGTDYAALSRTLLADQITAYYDAVTKKLVTSSPPDDATLVHEIEHALQDQRFDLTKLEAGEGDEALAHHALVEGDAVATTMEVLLARKSIDPPWANPFVVADVTRAIQLPDDPAFATAPPAIREQILFASRAGFAFVAALRASHSWSAVDDAFKRPPRSTEQILHLDKYLSDEKPVAVDAPTLEGLDPIHTTTWGELGFRLFLVAHGVDAARADLAAAGWAGDRVVTFSRGTRTAGVGRFAWDSEVDAIEAYDAAVHAIDESQLAAVFEHTETRMRWLAVDGTVSSVERDGTTLEIAVRIPASVVHALQ